MFPVMNKRFRVLGLVIVLIFVGGVWGCGEKQEPTDQSAWSQIKAALKQAEKWTNQRDPSRFTEAITEDFDAPAFVAAIWADSEAEKITFDPQRIRVSENGARAVVSVAYLQGDSTLTYGRFVVTLARETETWRLESFVIEDLQGI